VTTRASGFPLAELRRWALALVLALGPLLGDALAALAHVEACACCRAPETPSCCAASESPAPGPAVEPSVEPAVEKGGPRLSERGCACAVLAPAGATVLARTTPALETRAAPRLALERRIESSPTLAPGADAALSFAPGAASWGAGPPGLARAHGTARAAVLGVQRL